MSVRLRTKVQVAKLLCRPNFGTMVARTFSDRIPNGRVRILTSSPAVMPATKAALFWGLYERAEITLIRSGLRSDLDVVELGASIGVVAAHARRIVEPGRKYVAVEANPELIDNLACNLARARATSNNVVVHAAINSWDDEQTHLLLEMGEQTTGSKISTSSAVATSNVVSVPATTLHTLINEHHLEKYVLICDIEGAELSLLMREAQALSKCEQMLIELHRSETPEGLPYSIDDMRNIIEQELGFRLTQRHGNVFLYARG